MAPKIKPSLYYEVDTNDLPENWDEIQDELNELKCQELRRVHDLVMRKFEMNRLRQEDFNGVKWQ